MRLRYLELPRYGPLIDIAIVFGQEEMLFGWTPENQARRRGAINFVVGVNGTGKSSLLRAIYQTFRSLMLNEMPAQPVTLAWDRASGGATVTAILKVPANSSVEPPWFAIVKPVSDQATKADWKALVQNQGGGPLGGPIDFVGNGNPITTSLTQAHLPSKLVAYTSGAEMLWDLLDQSELHPDDGEDAGRTVEDERPPGWTLVQEMEEELTTRVHDLLLQYDPAESLPAFPASRLEPLKRLEQKLLTNQLLHEGQDWRTRSQNILRIRPADLRLAAIALSLWQAACDLAGKSADSDREALREQFVNQTQTGSPGEKARRVFNQLDWFWPTHLSFTYRDSEEKSRRQQREQLLCLLALADEVVQQPSGRNRAIVSLGPVGSIDLQSNLKDAIPSGLLSPAIDAIIGRVQGCRTGAEAVMRVFSDNKDLDATLMEVFYALQEWQRCGLLEEVTLTIKRLSRTTAADGDFDDVVVTLDHLSDGEQMLLGRIALLFLLREQHGTLLLLDEPETHFNDVWKREMIDLVDDGILKTTTVQVIVTTHTSIALSDVFSSEIVLLRRDPTTGQIYEASEPIETFGATPEDILRDVFQAGEVIGQRAAQILDLVLIVAANPQHAAPLWASGDFSGPAMQTLWQKAQRVPNSFRSVEAFSQFLASMWSFTRKQLNGDVPTLVDTLNAIENKLGPGHYQFEFRRRIHAETVKSDAASN
jgi:predicted ATPase